MNFSNLFGNKTKQPEPEYFLAVEIHESLIKTALWEVLEGEPSVVNVGSYESWADEESLINGVDSSLEQAVKVISAQPKKVIFGFPDSWMDEDKIHPTKIKLVSHLCKELGLEPIGAVTINRAIAHFLKKRDGVPPTTILLEVYTTKVALSYIYLGEVKNIEEVAKSGDIAHDVEEGLTRMDLSNYPARFILTNGSDLSEESQQITSFPWQDKLPFKHLPKVEALSVDFSIKAIALIGGTEAVRFMGVEVKDVPENHSPVKSEPVPSSPDSVEDLEVEESVDSVDNLVIPEESTPSIKEHGFSYEEVAAPEEIKHADHLSEQHFSFEDDAPPEEVSAIPEEDASTIIVTPSKPLIPHTRPQFKLPSLPKLPTFKVPKFKGSPLVLLVLPLLLIGGFVAYLFLGSAKIILHFSPQSYTQTLTVAVGQTAKPGLPTLIASSQKVNGSAKESVAATGQATVGDKATGLVTIANKTVAPLVLKKGTVITTDNGKYSYSLDSEVTVASASSSLLDIISGKTTGVRVTATKIGAEYNLAQDNTFTVDTYSRTVAIAISEKEFTGGASRSVTAVSKADQDKLIAQATEKIKQQTSAQVSESSPDRKSIPTTEIQITKKVFDKNIGEETATVNLDMEGSLEILVYSNSDLFKLVEAELKTKIPAGTTITMAGTNTKVDSLQKVEGEYRAAVTVKASLYPEINAEKLKEFVSGKSVNKIRHFFEPIKGFTDAEVNVTPPIPFLTRILPLKNIEFELVSN